MTRSPTETESEPVRETDQDPDDRGQRMLDWLLSNWLALTAGVLVGWLREFHRLPRPTRRKLSELERHNQELQEQINELQKVQATKQRIEDTDLFKQVMAAVRAELKE